MKPLLAELRKPVFWGILVLFLTVTFLHYSQYLPSNVSGLDSFLGASNQSIERLLLLIVILVGSVLFGLTVGLVFLVLSDVVMLPALFLSPGLGVNAIFEIVLVTATGLGFNLWFEERRCQVVNREQAKI